MTIRTEFRLNGRNDNAKTTLMLIIIIFLTILTTLFGGWLAMRFRDRLHLILGFSAGALLALVFLDLLPESIELTANHYSISQVCLVLVFGFLIYLILDRTLLIHSHDLSECNNQSHRGKLASISLIIHSLLDGLALGLAFKVSSAIGAVVAVAILSHRVADGLTLVGVMLKNRNRHKTTWQFLALDAVVPVLGIALAGLFSLPIYYLGLVLALFSGFFLYLGASDLLPESHHSHAKIPTLFATILGVVIIYLISRF